MVRSERSGHTTTDHDFIRRWVEERGGWPARVAGTSRGNDAGLIRIDFPGFSGEGSVERIEWDDWFAGFEANQLAFLHRDMDHGGGDLDRFNKLISRSGNDDTEAGEGGRGGSSARSRGASGGRSGSARKSGASEGKASSGRGGGARKAASTGGGRGGASTTADSGERGNGKASSGRGGSSRKTGAAEGGTSSARGASARGKEGGNGRRGAASAAADTGAKSTGARGGATAGGGGGSSAGPGNNSELRALLLHELGDLLSAERLFLGSTRTLAREAQDPEVRTRVEQHVSETEGQIERLKEAFGAVGERPRAVTCEAALGLKEEHDSFKSDEKPSRQLLSAFGLGSGLRVEHYEIAAYRSAIELATALGERECAGILNESLKEELAMASFLEKNSRAVLRRMVSGGGGGAGGAAEGRASRRGGSSAAKASGGTGSSAAKKSAGSGSSAAKKSAGSGSSSGKKSGGSGGGRARGGARA